MSPNGFIKLGKLTALFSFLIGTIIFGTFYYTSSSKYLFIGYGYILIALIVNLIVLPILLYKANRHKEYRKKLFIACKMMLANIPVAILYCWIAIILLNTLRITFTNDTKTVLTDITVEGCGGGHIDRLDIGESKTVWIDVPSDCAVSINYLSKGKRKTEQVVSYATTSMGQKMRHKIDGKNKDII